MKKEKNGKLSLDSFKKRSLANSNERNLTTLAGGILGACHTCTYTVFKDPQGGTWYTSVCK